MASEQEYRLLLEKAQECADCVKQFVSAVETSPRSHENPLVRDMTASALAQADDLQKKLDQIWDEFKRT